MQNATWGGAPLLVTAKKRKSEAFEYCTAKTGQKAPRCGKLGAIFPKSRKLLAFFAFFDKKFSTFSTNRIVENQKNQLFDFAQNIGI